MAHSFSIDQNHVITGEAELRSMFPEVSSLAQRKCLSELDEHAQTFIERSPFLCIGTQSGDGEADISPRGDPHGFVRVLDRRTLAIPDRPGNNRLDSLSNILSNPSVGLLFMIPGFDDTLRVNGAALLSTDPALLADMRVKNRIPKVAIVIKVREVFMHCAKAFRRSKLWDPAHMRDRSEMPSLSRIILDQTQAAPENEDVMRRIDDELEEEYKRTLY